MFPSGRFRIVITSATRGGRSASPGTTALSSSAASSSGSCAGSQRQHVHAASALGKGGRDSETRPCCQERALGNKGGSVQNAVLVEPEAEQQRHGAQGCQRQPDLPITLHQLPDLDLGVAGRPRWDVLV